MPAWQSAHRFQSIVCESEKYHASVMRDFTTGICMPEKLRYSQILIHCLKITTMPLMTGLTTGILKNLKGHVKGQTRDTFSYFNN